jgi:YHS domain-containing protein
MRAIRSSFLSVMVMLAVVLATLAFALDHYNTPGLVGYAPVAYFTDGKAMRGSGYHVAVHDGVTYAFTSEEHMKMFEANPRKYLLAYGGYCAMASRSGKVVDPEAWKIVDGHSI